MHLGLILRSREARVSKGEAASVVIDSPGMTSVPPLRYEDA